jgi:eukaryotic-like serine/threonine-protein kinase
MRSNASQYSEIAGYRLTRHIGSGGMGDVYKAHHPMLNREAAVKILYQKELADRFDNEAYIQSSITHPNIARLYEYISSGEIHCIIMEYVEGESLDTYIHKKGKLTNDETEKILAQIVSALSYLHSKDILHRDIKPQNFKLQPDGTVKMLDFGIAKHKYSPKLTQQGFVVGTTEYMAPEQFQEQVQKKSDIWSLGVMAYEMLTGYMPFEATNPISLRLKISKANFTDPKILVPQISEKLETIIDKSLRVNPAIRISAAEIEELLKGKKIKPEKKADNTVIKLSTRHKQILAGIFLVAILITGVSQLTKQTDKPEIDEPDKPAVNTIAPAEQRKIKIYVPGVQNAVLILPNREPQPVPYEISGKSGDIVEFTIHADGYVDKTERIEISHRRSSYECNLQKIND